MDSQFIYINKGFVETALPASRCIVTANDDKFKIVCGDDVYLNYGEPQIWRPVALSAGTELWNLSECLEDDGEKVWYVERTSASEYLVRVGLFSLNQYGQAKVMCLFEPEDDLHQILVDTANGRACLVRVESVDSEGWTHDIVGLIKKIVGDGRLNTSNLGEIVDDYALSKTSGV